MLTESTTRAPLLLLPILFTLADIGLFDAADRIRLTLGIMVAVATTAIMPALSRAFAGESADRHALVSFSVKYVCVILSCAALGISIFADVIVRILYGAQFAASALLLQVLIWTQVLVATDAMLKQAMIANGQEYAVVTRALAGLAVLALLVLGLGHEFGLVGAAAGVLTASAFTLVSRRCLRRAQGGRLRRDPLPVETARLRQPRRRRCWSTLTAPRPCCGSPRDSRPTCSPRLRSASCRARNALSCGTRCAMASAGPTP